ncbi:hypothetical protein B566_EDAN001032 [Ephemera danica]|nr:hypothetical protein B566_EDAN001032 [Ephemera danica]
MTDKLHDYQGPVGRLHEWRDSARQWLEQRREQCGQLLSRHPTGPDNQDGPPPPEDFSHIYRRKTRNELVRISAAVMGIEFSYAAETAFVSPTLLQIGVEHRLLLVPNGEALGYWFGDSHGIHVNASDVGSNKNGVEPLTVEASTGNHPWGVFFTVLGTVLLDFDADACQSPARAYLLDVTQPDTRCILFEIDYCLPNKRFIIILYTLLIEDHARGLSTFTIMAGLGGCMGYALGGINWDNTFLGKIVKQNKPIAIKLRIAFLVDTFYSCTTL